MSETVELRVGIRNRTVTHEVTTDAAVEAAHAETRRIVDDGNPHGWDHLGGYMSAERSVDADIESDYYRIVEHQTWRIHSGPCRHEDQASRPILGATYVRSRWVAYQPDGVAVARSRKSAAAALANARRNANKLRATT